MAPAPQLCSALLLEHPRPPPLRCRPFASSPSPFSLRRLPMLSAAVLQQALLRPALVPPPHRILEPLAAPSVWSSQVRRCQQGQAERPTSLLDLPLVVQRHWQ